MGARLSALLIILCPLAWAAGPDGPTSHAKTVLFIYDEDLDIPATRLIDERVKSEVREAVPSAQFVTETLGSSRFSEPGYKALVREQWRRKYARSGVDVLVICMGRALELFADDDRPFPGTPIVFCLADRELVSRL